ncbi:MAG: NADH-quinone oxidoreductase subunit L [Bacteroidetes bacterium]|nr:NADH-quinone oxidoreductase subunit L [Bacteroidota bacterium]
MMKLAALVPLFPLVGFILNGLFGKKMSKGLSGTIASVAMLLSFGISLAVFLELQTAENKATVINLFSWISSDTLQVPFEFLIDPLSSVFLLIITGIGFLIHIYSLGYMKHDDAFARFFAYLNLFVFFMLLLVMGNNYLILFMGWEGVGLCSYLLIGFWFKNNAYNDAAKKAFIINRIGDLGFLLGIFLIFTTYGSTTFGDIFPNAGMASPAVVTTIALLLFFGATGKSAQIPLFTWLPDAMAGPTPVSALIHAATMVTAGVYMIVRSNIFYSMSETASAVVAIVGLATALIAALIGLFQNDIKKILAYSTVSQLGLMFLGLGAGAFSSSVFHVTTHAFFKALLFLAAGSVIHAMGGEQDIRKMGGLKGKIKITFITMLIGTIAISGIPPLSGFFSKDEIMAHVFEYNGLLWFFAMIVSALTAFYMFRLIFLTFYGKFRGTSEQEHHLHESPPTMTIPLVVLAALAIFGGLLGLPEFWGMSNWMAENLDTIIMHHHETRLSHQTEWILMGLAVVSALIIILIAYNVYRKKGLVPVEKEQQLKDWQRPIFHKFYVDEIYDFLVRRPVDFLSESFYKVLDLQVVSLLVDGIGNSVKTFGSYIRLIQNGNVSTYIVGMVMSIICILLFIFLI